MKLHVTKRSVGKKSEINQIRREGNIPSVLYSKGEKGTEMVVNGIAFKKLINSIESGTLSSKVLVLELDGKEIKALVKEIQYHPTTYQVLHLDFTQLHDDVNVTLNVPLKSVGSVDCVGVKQGGVFRQMLRYVKALCLPKDIPARFELDVKNLALGQSLRVEDLKIPAGVTLKCNPRDIAVVVSRR